MFNFFVEDQNLLTCTSELTLGDDQVLCSLCNAACANLVEHCIHGCVGLLFERRRLWFELSCIDVNVHAVLFNLDKCFLTIALLGGDIVQLYDLLQAIV